MTEFAVNQHHSNIYFDSLSLVESASLLTAALFRTNNLVSTEIPFKTTCQTSHFVRIIALAPTECPVLLRDWLMLPIPVPKKVFAKILQLRGVGFLRHAQEILNRFGIDGRL